MSNFLVHDEKTIVYNIPNLEDRSIIMIIDKDMPPGTVRWDVLGTGNIFYNLPEFSKIVKISDTLQQIYVQYIDTGKLNKIPKPDTKLPNWVTFNPENNSHYINFDYVFTISIDTSAIPTCKFFTSSASDFKSSSYQYANNSIGNVCSEPTLNSNSSESVIYCPYSLGLKNMTQNACPKYSQDVSVLHDIILQSKFSENKINITVSLSRMDMGKSLVLVFEDKINNSVFHKLSFSSLDKSQLESIPSMTQTILDEVLAQYTDFQIMSKTLSEQNVIIKKRSFISSLVEDKKEDLYV